MAPRLHCVDLDPRQPGSGMSIALVDDQEVVWLQAAPGATNDFRAMLRGLPDDANDAPPGLAFSYSNVGLDLVGALVDMLRVQNADVPRESRFVRCCVPFPAPPGRKPPSVG